MAGASALTLVAVAVAAVAVVAAPVSDADMRRATDALLVEVGAVRRIAPRGTLERRVVTRAQARAARDEAAAAALGTATTEGRARLWERMGLLPAGADEARLVADALDAAPTASYDPARQRLSVPDWIPLPEQRTALAHALAHALADQRFGLRGLLHIDAEGRHHLDGDDERARLALVEGDASVTALELDDPRGAFGGGHALPALAATVGGAAPDWVRANLAFAHGDGLAFVARVRARQPWSAVDALWADPPRSSEQILHPDKYDARDAPVVVAPPKPRALGDAWREASSDVLGELGVRVWLAAVVPREIAERAAAGWGGDRATLFDAATTAVSPVDGGAAADVGAPSSSFVLWTTGGDDVPDAEDFARVAPSALAALARVTAATTDDPHRDDPHRFVARGAAGVYALVWRGASVSLLLGAPEATLPALDALAAQAPSKPAPRVRRRPRN